MTRQKNNTPTQRRGSNTVNITSPKVSQSDNSSIGPYSSGLLPPNNYDSYAESQDNYAMSNSRSNSLKSKKVHT